MISTTQSATYADKIAFALLAITGILASISLLWTKYFYLSPAVPVALIFLVCFLKHYRIGIFLIIFLIPFGAFRKFGGINIPWVLAGITLLVVLIKVVTRQQSLNVIKGDIVLLLFLFIVVNFISTLLSPYPDTALSDFLLWISACLFVFVFIMVTKASDVVSVIPKILVTSVTIGSILAVLGFFFNITLFAEAQISGTFSRGTGGAIDPNNLSLMIIAILPFIVHQIFFSDSVKLKVFSVLIFFINICAVATTYSRGGFLVLFAALALIMLQYRTFVRAKHLPLLLVGFFMFLVVLLAIMPDSFIERQSSIARWEDKSLNRRTSYLLVAKESFIKKPLLGTGPATFSELFNDSYYAKLYETEGKTNKRRAHNTYVEIIIGSGIVGFSLFMALLNSANKKYLAAIRYFITINQPKLSYLFASYRLFFINVLLYLAIFSETHHKFLLVALPTAQLVEYFIKNNAKELVNAI